MVAGRPRSGFARSCSGSSTRWWAYPPSSAPYDKRLSDLIGELSTRSEEFRVHWAAHNVKLHRTGVKRFHHPVVGELTLDFESLDLPGDPGQKLLVYSAEPVSPSHQALHLLASWASTPQDQPADRRT